MIKLSEDEEIVGAIINLVKRIHRIETRIAILEAIKQLPANAERKSWEDWARKVILKIIEWFIIVVSAIIGVKMVSN